MARRAKTLRRFQPRRYAVARGDEQHKNPKSDIDIAQAAAMRPIGQVAADKLGIPDEALSLYGRYNAKGSMDYIRTLADRPQGKLILVTAITPTPAGEGKTTTTVGLGDALNHIGKKAILCLREPSLGPSFGMKGGAAGGGYAQVVPMEDINLHFTGDFNAIQLANNLLAAMIDNHINHGNELGFDVRRIAWKRVMDMNDRALRQITIALGGPFANIAHGCNSVLATQTALKLADYVITEAGFGADLGAEKFVDIKCRKAGLKPSAVVLVATIRALKYHGGVDVKELGKPNLAALEKGIANIERHVNNIRNNYGLPCVVSINHRTEDTDAEVKLLMDKMAHHGAKVILARHWAEGGKGAVEVAREVARLCDEPTDFKFVYDENATLCDKMKAIATKIYGASDITADSKVRAQIKRLQESGYGHYPICVAKTQYSFSTDPQLRGAPSGHVVNVREVRLAAGAEFVVMICGDIMTMPGLPKVPSAVSIDVDDGKVVGLF